MLQTESDVSTLTRHRPPRAARTLRADRHQRPSTVAAYARDLEKFINTYGGTIPSSPERLIEFIKLLVKRVSPVTIARRCMAIQDAHLRGGHPSPTHDPRLREAIRWMVAGQVPHNLIEPTKRTRGSASTPVLAKVIKRQAKPITRTMLMRMLDAQGSGLRSRDKRDKAILLLGFAGLKRGEICGLNIEDAAWTPDALVLRLRVADDTTGSDLSEAHTGSRTVSIPLTRGPLCAGTACRQWLEHCDLIGKTGPMFCRFDRGSDPVFGSRLDSAWVSATVKEHLRAAGVSDVADYSAESLRRGGADDGVRVKKR